MRTHIRWRREWTSLRISCPLRLMPRCSRSSQTRSWIAGGPIAGPASAGGGAAQLPRTRPPPDVEPPPGKPRGWVPFPRVPFPVSKPSVLSPKAKAVQLAAQVRCFLKFGGSPVATYAHSLIRSLHVSLEPILLLQLKACSNDCERLCLGCHDASLSVSVAVGTCLVLISAGSCTQLRSTWRSTLSALLCSSHSYSH